MARQRVSDTLKHQDMRTAAGLLIAVQALGERYPHDMNLALAARGLDDFRAGLEEKPIVPAPVGPRSLSEIEHVGAFPSSEETGS